MLGNGSYEHRGSYNHTAMARQLLRFDGLDYVDNITPMDIDCTLEYKDRSVVLIEIKRVGVKMLYGQRLTLERYVKDFTKAGKRAIAVVAEHKVFDPSKDVIVADCLVREMFYGKEGLWRPPTRMITVKTLLDTFLEL